MTTPIHQYVSVPVAGSSPRVADLLRAQAADLAPTITADVIDAMAPIVTRWGLHTSGHPTVVARPADDDELGCVAISWAGQEDATGWPAISGLLLVVPDAIDTTRLVFVSPRSPRSGLATGQLDPLHRHRVVHVTVQQFLHRLAERLWAPDVEVAGAATGADDRPMYLHHLRPIADDPHWLLDRMTHDPLALAVHATTAALSQARDTLDAGRFRAPAEPTVHVRPGRPDELGAVHIRWEIDEEASGVPALEFALLVEAHQGGARLAVLSSRPPGYDLSVNRMDKAQRDQILRRVGADVGDAIIDRLATAAVSVPA